LTIHINNIKLSIDEEGLNAVKNKTAKISGVPEADMSNFRILKESVDARKKNDIFFVYQAEFNCENEKKTVQRANSRDVIFEEDIKKEDTVYGTEKMKNRPVVVGSGPAGLFCGLTLAANGYNPIILERGEDVDKRTEKIKHFWKHGDLDTECNVQFGEGGAGTFSDGKLTTRIKDARCEYVLDEFVKAGAPKEIMYSGKPHIGTDILRDVVRNIRNKIIEFGGEVRFSSKVTDILINNSRIFGVKVNNEYELPSEAVIFAIGHSARDTYEMLLAKGLQFEQKPFAIGVRVEHLQSMIDENQYGKMAVHKRLRAADYRLTYSSIKYQRPCYSFCMCPGGVVVAAASEKNRLVTNGMSEYKRDGNNANSALVVGVTGQDFKSSHPLAGVEFQRYYEHLAFTAGGGNYTAPVQLAGDFIKDKISNKLGSITPSYTGGYIFSDLRNCLPDFVIEVLKEGLMDFDRKIKGFAAGDAVLTGIETRTSSPVRMTRENCYESVNIQGFYPCGEGAGYAGGIVSAAVDGIRTAEKIMQKYAQISL
jgi:uncharacterized FAD-dependent dehydrogenase